MIPRCFSRSSTCSGRWLATGLLVMLLPSICGCGVFYKHRLETPVGPLWTNGDIETARRYQKDLGWMKAGLCERLPIITTGVGSASILLKTEDRNRIIREDEIRTAGWYNHALSLIQFTPSSPADRILLQRQPDPFGHRTLLHELTHHYTAGDSRIRSKWWLTEAISCSMESSFLDHRGQFQVPPLHPLQYRKAREVLSDLGRARFTEFAEEIVSESWLGFYRNDGEIPARYAISWAILWTLQDQMSGTHETRLLAVIGLKKDQIVARIPDVIEAITPSLSTQYRRYLESDRYRRWAIDQWLLDDRIDGRAILAAIEVELLDSLASAWAWSCTTNLILRTRSRLDRKTRSEWQQRIIEQLESGTMEVRQAICTAIPEYRWADQLIPALIELLETDRAELRAAAAAALSRISRHPTIVNPAFWISAAESDRSREIGEWRTWLGEN